MKLNINKVVLLVILGISTLSNIKAQTNSVCLETNEVGGKSEVGTYEFTLGGSGTSVDGANSFGFDVSLSSNPLESAPNLWVGIVQGFYWEPKLSGSTDLNVNWSWHLFGDIYLNTGWSGGIVYNRTNNEDEDNTFEHYFRTGPEATFQYYVGDNAFIYSGVNYDIELDNQPAGFRYSFGIGLAF